MKGNYTVYQEYYNKMVDEEIENSNFEEFNSSSIESNYNSFRNLISEAQSKVNAANDIIDNTLVTRTEASNYIDENGNYRRAKSEIPAIENQTLVNEQKNYRNELNTKIDLLQKSISNLNSDSAYLSCFGWRYSEKVKSTIYNPPKNAYYFELRIKGRGRSKISIFYFFMYQF